MPLPPLGCATCCFGVPPLPEGRVSRSCVPVRLVPHSRSQLIACDIGCITGGTVATLHRLSKNAAEGRDGTVYGVHSNANYFTHTMRLP